jgi:hypothetical protein
VRQLLCCLTKEIDRLERLHLAMHRHAFVGGAAVVVAAGGASVDAPHSVRACKRALHRAVTSAGRATHVHHHTIRCVAGIHVHHARAFRHDGRGPFTGRLVGPTRQLEDLEVIAAGVVLAAVPELHLLGTELAVLDWRLASAARTVERIVSA